MILLSRYTISGERGDRAVMVGLSAKSGKPSQELLVNAIKAEYSQFSANGLLPRPSAAALRGYFKELSKQLRAPADGAGKP